MLDGQEGDDLGNPDKLAAYLSEAEQNHFKLLIVPESAINKEKMIAFLKTKEWQEFNVTKEFLDILKDIPKEKMRLRGSIELEKWLQNLKGDKFIFYNIDMLFSPELGKIDPIRLFKYFSRNHRSVLFFPGRIRGSRAEYSLEGKPDHMVMDVSEVLCYTEERKESERNA